MPEDFARRYRVRKLTSVVMTGLCATAVVVASKQHKKPPAAVADPGAEPPLSGAMCPPSTVFGIAAADLNPAKAS